MPLYASEIDGRPGHLDPYSRQYICTERMREKDIVREKRFWLTSHTSLAQYTQGEPVRGNRRYTAPDRNHAAVVPIGEEGDLRNSHRGP